MNITEYIEADVNVIVKDDRFDIHDLFNYHLTLEVSDHGFGLCVVDQETLRCLRLEKFEFDSNTNEHRMFELLDEIYEEHQFLQAGYWKSISVSYVGTKFTLMPSALFDEKLASKYLGLNTPINESDTVKVYPHKGNNLVNIFAIPTQLEQYFQSKYPEKRVLYTHVTSSLIEGAYRLESKETPQLLLHFKQGELVVLLKNNNKVDYCNIFSYKTEEDALYFIVFVISELQLNQETVALQWWSDMKLSTSMQNKLSKYVRNIQAGKRPVELKFGYFFDELEDYRFNSLYNIHLCE